ncbi:hypothetical protein HYH03_013230 [Edaphochlamys debaryana]|uniref:Uncharacterized protein n=1 Tax=Edaphochlamys debaryana TaxID=47281 RepID=A0A835XZ07_9CHLO|nr:hypothetical protein HYH03_013230 [Edaphochlamys debaryana]|eukprot:KAG2488239.1 hypothetical protein HYH03_013230 [Edaphochlamys debaryana]
MDLSVVIGDAASPQAPGGSARLGADGPRKSPDGVGALRKSLNSSGFCGTPTGDALLLKRRAASEFIKQCTGEDVAYSNDHHFRQMLANGVLLCQTLNRVVPNAVREILPAGSEDPDHSNVRAFITYTEKMQFPSEARFFLNDLLSDGYDDRPRVTDCILWLRKVHTGHDPSPSPFPGYLNSSAFRDQSDTRAVRDSPRKSPLSATLQLHQQQQENLAMVVGGARTIGSVQPNANMAMLCSNVSQSLMAKLQPGVQPAKYDTIVSDVLGQWLNNLTVEYERRLLAKDHEMTALKSAQAQLSRTHKAVLAQLDQLQESFDSKVSTEVQKATQDLELQLKQLRDSLEAAHAALQAREEELASTQAALGSHDAGRTRAEAEAVARLAEVQAELAEYQTLQQRFLAVREENRRLYNQVQDLKGSIRVFCRVRPVGTTGDSTPSCLDMGTENELAVYDKSGERKVYKFDRVFCGGSTQEQIYEDVQGLVRSVMDGYNVCIFAYGQTGSGKTHTMTGTTVDDVAGRGINYRALDDLFALRTERDTEMSYTITAQMLEIYNETIRDLLSEEQGKDNKLDIHVTQPSGLNVPGATQIPVDTTSDVLAMMRVGARNRHSAETRMNERSSRSHQVLTIIVDGVNRVTGAKSHACLHLVDLAGSERTDKSGVEGERMREANAINTSLSALGTVMNCLASKTKHVPFRDSKLTQLLQDSLQGNAKVTMLMHVAPEGSSHLETVSTLNFGNRVASVTLGQAKQNVESGKVFEAQETANRLKEQLAVARETQTAQQRQLLEQAELIRSLRAQLAAAQGDSGPCASTRTTDSFRTANTHTDTAGTPSSHIRRPGSSTPRNQGIASNSDHLNATPRSQSFRSPAPLPLHGLLRSSSGMTPRGAAAASPGPSMSEGGVAAEEQADKVGPLNSARGVRSSQPLPENTVSALAEVRKQAIARLSAIPKLGSTSTSASTKPSGTTGSSSARTFSGRYSTGGMGSASGTDRGTGTSTSGAAPSAAATASLTRNKSVTSRTSSVYGGSSALAGPVSRSASVVLAEVPGTKPASGKPPLSSRPGSGWHR